MHNSFKKSVSSVLAIGMMLPMALTSVNAQQGGTTSTKVPTLAVATSYDSATRVFTHPGTINTFDSDIGANQVFSANYFYQGRVPMNLYYTPPTPALNGQKIVKFVDNPSSPKFNQEVGSCIIGTDVDHRGVQTSGTCITKDTVAAGTPATDYVPEVISDGTVQPAYRYTASTDTLYQKVKSDIEGPSNLQVTMPTRSNDNGATQFSATATDKVSAVGGYYYRWNSNNWTNGQNLNGYEGLIGIPHAETTEVTGATATNANLKDAPKLGLNTITFWARDSFYNIATDGVTKQFLNTKGYTWTNENTSEEGVGKGKDVPLRPTIKAKVKPALKGVKYTTQIINNATGKPDTRFTCTEVPGTAENGDADVICTANTDLAPKEVLDYTIRTTGTSTLDGSDVGTKDAPGSLTVRGPSDNTPPVITPDTTKKNKVSATITDDGKFTCEYWYKDNPTVKKAYVTGTELDILKEHHNKVIVWSCTDDAGNTSTKEQTLTYVDNPAPVVTPDVTKTNIVKAKITDNDLKDATYHYADKPNEKFTYTSDTELPIKKTDDGRTIVFTATDHGGNVTEKSQILRYVSPTISITMGGIVDNGNNTQKEEPKKEEPKKEEPKKEDKKAEKVNIIFNPGAKCTGLKQVLTENELKFRDIDNSGFKRFIQNVAMYRGDVSAMTYPEFGVVNNVDFYNPDRSITRAEYVKMIVRALACNFGETGNNPTFSDVDQNEWYAEYINYAVKTGWVNGYADGTFRPNAPISRQEAAKILARAANLKLTTEKDYADVNRSSEFHKYISTLGAYNIVSSRATHFNPTANMSRGEFAKVVSNVIMNKK